MVELMWFFFDIKNGTTRHYIIKKPHLVYSMSLNKLTYILSSSEFQVQINIIVIVYHTVQSKSIKFQ